MFDPQTTDELFDNCDALTVVQPNLSKTAFKKAEQRLGLTYNPHGVLWDPELRPLVNPLVVGRVDPAHTLLCDGLAQKLTTAFFRKCVETGIDAWGPLREQANADWVGCRVYGGPKLPVANTFSTSRQKHFQKEHAFACGASEMMNVLPIMMFALEMQPVFLPLVRERRAFAALCKLVQTYRRAKGGHATADELRAAVADHAVQKTAAFSDLQVPDGIFVPKDHQAMHLPAQLAADGELLDTLVTERFHCVAKHAMTAVENTKKFEATVLARVVCLHTQHLRRNGSFTTRLLEPIHLCDAGVFPGVADARRSKFMNLEGTRVGAGDLLYVDPGDDPLLLAACVSLDGRVGFVGHPLAFERQAARGLGVVVVAGAGGRRARVMGRGWGR